MEFVGRAEDLALIEETYKTRKFNCCAIIGRRRIGKSTLIQKFVEGKRHIYFEFAKGLPETNLRIMENVMCDFKGSETRYRDFIEAFGDLSRTAKKEELVIVFDEFTYALSYESFSSLTKNLADRGLGSSFLIICGSLVGMMEDEIENYSKPLYGRTRRIDISGIGLEDSRQFHPDMPDMDILRLHILTGGSPFYLADTPADSLGEYFDRYVLPTRGIFHDEGERIIARELENPSKYNSILDALAVGRNDVKHISEYTGIDETTCRGMMSKLTEMGIVENLTPMCGAPSKPIRYRFSDGMVALHFRIFRNRGTGPNVTYAMFEDRVLTEMGRLFENYCARFLSDRYPVRAVGTWFDRIPVRDDKGNVMKEDGKTVTENVDIDLVADAFDGKNETEIFAECKLRNSPSGIGELNELRCRMDHIHGKRNARMLLISTGGFTEQLRDEAASEGVLLIDNDMLFGRKDVPPL